MFNGYNEAPNFYNQGLFDNCNHSGLLSGEMSKHTSAPPWEYSTQPYNNLPCYSGQQHLSHRQLPLIHDQVVSQLEKKDSSLHGSNSSNFSSNSVHQSVVKPTALINCQSNCNACCSHANRVSHHWNPTSENVRYLDHTSLSKELPRYPHGVSNFPTEDARFVGDFSNTFEKLPFFPRDAVENLSHVGVAGAANKKEFSASVLHGNHQNTTINSVIEPVKKEKCTKCRGICRSNCKQSKQQSTVKVPNQDQLHVSRENVVRYPSHHSLNSTTWPISSQAQSGMWFQNAQPAFWMSHNDVQMPSSDSFGYWANNEELSSNMSLHHARSGMQNPSRYPLHAGSQDSFVASEAEQNKFKGMAYQDTYKHKCAEVKGGAGNHGEILRKELQEPLQNHKVSKQRLEAARSLDMCREFVGRNCDVSASSQVHDTSKTSVYESSAESYAGGDDANKLYGGSNSIRPNATNFSSYPFVNVNNGYNVGLPQSLSQFSSHIPYNQAKLERGNSYVNSLQYSNTGPVGPFMSSHIENNQSNNYVPAVAKATPPNHHPLPNSCIQYSPSKKNSAGDFNVSSQSSTHPVSDIKYNFTNSGNDLTYSMLQSCNKIPENVACGKAMQMSVPDTCIEKIGSKTNPYYFSKLHHSTNSNYQTVSRNLQMKPPFCFDSVDARKDSTSCSLFCEGASNNHSTSNFQYDHSDVQNSSGIDISPSAHVGDSSPVQVDSPFVTHSPAGVNRPIKKRQPRPKCASRNEQLHKGPILDVRQYLATWDEESDDVTTMHRLTDVMHSGNAADSLEVLNNDGGSVANPGLGLVPMYNKLADDSSESSSVHSENASHLCQHASIENLTEAVDKPKTSSGCLDLAERRLENLVSNGKQDGGISVDGNMNGKCVGNVTERQISPTHPVMPAQSLGHNSDVSPGDSQNMVSLHLHTQKYSGLENNYLSTNDESGNLSAECCKIDYVNESKATPARVSSAQSFDTATTLLSEEDNVPLSSCDLVSNMHITTPLPVSRENVISDVHIDSPVGAACVKEVTSVHEDSSKSSSVVENDKFAETPKTSLSVSHSCENVAFIKDETNVQREDLVCNAVDPVGTSKDAHKACESTKQLEALHLYSGHNDSSGATACNGVDTASQSHSITSGGAVQAPVIAVGSLEQPGSDREVFISGDIQFPDLSYSNSESSVDGDVQAAKGAFCDDVASSPQSLHDVYPEKHSDPSFIRSFVNEIASNIPNLDSHLPCEQQDSAIVDPHFSSNLNMGDECSEAKLRSECNVLAPSDLGSLSQGTESETGDKEVAERKDLQDDVEELSRMLRKSNTVITNANCHALNDEGGFISNADAGCVKNSSKESLQKRKTIKLRPSLGPKVGSNKIFNSHFAKRKIMLRTYEAKKPTKKLPLKTGVGKCMMKERKKYRQYVKKKLFFSSKYGKNGSPDILCHSNVVSDGKVSELGSNVKTMQDGDGNDSKFEKLTDNGTASTLIEKVITTTIQQEGNSNSCEETETAVNLVLESSKHGKVTGDVGSECLVKHFSEPIINYNIEHEKNTVNGEMAVNVSKGLVIQNDASELCERVREEAVDLRVSKSGSPISGNENLYFSGEVRKQACNKETCQEIRDHTNGAPLNISEWNSNSSNVHLKENKVSMCSKFSHCKSSTLVDNGHAHWQNGEMWNHNAASFQRRLLVERNYDTDRGLIFNCEPLVTAKHLQSSAPIQAEALDLCKPCHRGQTKEHVGKKGITWGECSAVNVNVEGQGEQKNDTQDFTVEENINKINCKEKDMNHKSKALGFKEGSSVIVLRGSKISDVLDGDKSKGLDEESEDVTVTTLLFGGDDCLEDSTVGHTNNVVEEGLVIRSVGEDQTPAAPKLLLCAREKITSDSCKESETYTSIYEHSKPSASPINCTDRAHTHILQNISFLNKPQTQESSVRTGLSPIVGSSQISTATPGAGTRMLRSETAGLVCDIIDLDAHKGHESDDCDGRKLTSVNSSECSKHLDLSGGDKHEANVLESPVDVLDKDTTEPSQDDNHKTAVTTTASDEKYCKSSVAADENLHSTSLDFKDENICELQKSDSGCVTKAEDVKQSDWPCEIVCKRESVNVLNEEDERQIPDNSQPSEIKLLEDNMYVTETHSLDSVQVCGDEQLGSDNNCKRELKYSASPECNLSDSEPSPKLHLQKNTCMETASSINHFQQDDEQQELDNNGNKGSIEFNNDVCKQLKNLNGGEIHHQENNISTLTSCGSESYELLQSSENLLYEKQISISGKPQINDEIKLKETNHKSEVIVFTSGECSEEHESGVNVCKPKAVLPEFFSDKSDKLHQLCRDKITPCLVPGGKNFLGLSTEIDVQDQEYSDIQHQESFNKNGIISSVNIKHSKPILQFSDLCRTESGKSDIIHQSSDETCIQVLNNKNEQQFVVPNNGSCKKGGQAIDNLCRYESHAHTSFQDEKQCHIQEDGTSSTDDDQLKNSDFQAQDSELPPSDSSLRISGSKLGHDVNEKVSTEAEFNGSETSELIVRSEPSDNSSQTEIANPVSTPSLDSEKVNLPCSIVFGQEMDVSISGQAEVNTRILEDSLLDQASDKSTVEVQNVEGTAVNKSVVNVCGSITNFRKQMDLENDFCRTAVDNFSEHILTKDHDSEGSAIPKHKDILVELNSLSVTTCDHVENSTVPEGGIVKCIESVTLSDDRICVGATVQESSNVSADITVVAEKNCQLTGSLVDSRTVSQSKLVADPQSSVAVGASTENTTFLLEKVVMETDKKLKEDVPFPIDNNVSSSCVPDFTHTLCESDEMSNKFEFSTSKVIADSDPSTHYAVDSNEKFDEEVTVECNEDVLFISDNSACLTVDVNNSNGENNLCGKNNLCSENETVKGQGVVDDIISENKVLEKNKASESVTRKHNTAPSPENMPSKAYVSDFELPGNTKEDCSFLGNCVTHHSEVSVPNISCENGHLCAVSEKQEKGTRGVFIENSHEDNSHQRGLTADTVDFSSETICEHNSTFCVDKEAYNCVNQVNKNVGIEYESQSQFESSTCTDEHIVNKKQTTDFHEPEFEIVRGKELEQQEPNESMHVEETKASYSSVEDCDKLKFSVAMLNKRKECVGECEEKSVQESLSPQDELVEDQVIIIQNNCSDDITNSINISAESVAVNSVCVEGLEHGNDDSKEISTWPIIVESDEATEIIIAVTEGISDEAAENEMSCFKFDPPYLKSPEMPHLEAMTKHYESDGNDQDLEMPVLDVSTSVTTDAYTNTTNVPQLERVIMSPVVEVKMCQHTSTAEFGLSLNVPTEKVDVLESQQGAPIEDDIVLKTSEATSGTQEFYLLETVNSFSSPKENNVLSSTEVGNIFPALASDSVEQAFHDNTHILPGDSVSNWPYLEEEVLSELLAPDPETTVPLPEVPSDTDTVVTPFPLKPCSIDSRLDEANRKVRMVTNKFRARGWSKKRILYYYNSYSHKNSIKKNDCLNWNRICARSKIGKSKSFKANKNKVYKIPQSWPYFARSPGSWLQKKTKLKCGISSNNIISREGDCHSKIEVRLAQKCEQVGGVKTWCVVGSSKNNDSWPVIEENNNVMTTNCDLSESKEDKVPIVLVKRLTLKKSNSNSDGEGTQEYTVKSADNISSTTCDGKVSGKTEDECEAFAYRDKVIKRSISEGFLQEHFVTSKDCSVDGDCTSNISCSVEESSLKCTVCDSNAPTVSSPEYCKRHSPKLFADSNDNVSTEDHQVSNNAHQVPRVIIKRTGPGSAKYQSFLRTSPDGSQWQPVVQLLRSKVLDNLARNVLEVGSVKKVISLNKFRLVLRKRSNVASESAVEHDVKLSQPFSEALQDFEEVLAGEEDELVDVLPDFEKEKTVKNTSSCKYVVLENNTKDTLLTFQRLKSDSEVEEEFSEHSNTQVCADNVSLLAEGIGLEAKEVLPSTHSHDEHIANRNRDRKCKAVFTYMESSSEDSQENNAMLCPVIRINRKRLLEHEDKFKTNGEACSKRQLICSETAASSADSIMPATSGKRKYSFFENTESSRKKAHLGRCSSISVDGDSSRSYSVGSVEDGMRPLFKERGFHRHRSLRCKNVVAASDNESSPDMCRVCHYTFVDEEDKADHVKQHPYHCQRCHLAFQSKMDFRNHLSSMHPRTKEQHHCLLCERTFPTAARHRVHLTGRQHRYLEMTQRRTIHTLFKLFTNEFCPALPSPTREELAGLSWFPSEPGTIHFYHQATPLQLAVQDLMWRRRQVSESGPDSVAEGSEGR